MPSDGEWLLRRVGPRGRDKSTGRVKAVAFNLRPAQGETELSMYLEEGCDVSTLLARAPDPGYGVARVLVANLRALGMTVNLSLDEDDPELGELHVAVSSTLNAEGQIPLPLREAISWGAQWVVEPS